MQRHPEQTDDPTDRSSRGPIVGGVVVMIVVVIVLLHLLGVIHG
jgi:hypothetical protein